jgi:exopolysaccharide biosynthesis polyprenyl glycosylphosphotransferase
LQFFDQYNYALSRFPCASSVTYEDRVAPRKGRGRGERRGRLVLRSLSVRGLQASSPGRLEDCHSPAGLTAKRILDILGATFGLILCAPLFLVVAVLILVTSGRPIFYSQERVGRGGRIFRILKFRSMRRDAEAKSGPIWATARDTRCTTIGDWLRRYNIDELPQLVNVLRGEMSLVGPRPERPIFVEQFSETYPTYDQRHDVAVGMTGWAQVHGWRGRTSLRKRLQYDLDYIGRWSFWLDLRILYMTVEHILWGKTSWAPTTSAAPRRQPVAIKHVPYRRHTAACG